MKKFFVILCGLFFGAAQVSTAQVAFMHSLGLSIYSAGNAGGITGTYSPRLNLIKVGDNGNLSLGTHFSLGGSFNSREGGSISFDFPIMAEINMGNGASKESESKFGFFGGLGFGFSALTSDVEVQSTSGPVIDAGIRFILAEKYPLSVRASYLFTSNPTYPSVFGLGVSYNFGILK